LYLTNNVLYLHSNEIGGRINTEVRKAYRVVSGLKFDDLKVSLKEISPFEINTARYPIESVHREFDEIPKFVTRPITSDAPDDATGKQIIEDINKFTEQWKETQERWKRAFDITKQVHHVASLLSFCDEGIKKYEELMKTNYTYANWNNNAGYFNSDIPTTSHDYDICLQVIDLSDLAVSYIQKFEAANNGAALPKKQIFLKKAEEFRKKAIQLHPYLLIHKILTMAGNLGEGRKAYWNALRRFPKARASAMQQYKEHEDRQYERRPWDRKEAKQHAPFDPFDGQVCLHIHKTWIESSLSPSFHLSCSCSNNNLNNIKTISDAFEEDQDYHPAAEYEILVPYSDPSLAVRQQKSAKDSKLWTDLHKKWAGKIVFSNSPIDSNSPVEKDTKTSFTGNEEIYARGFWPNAIAQIPIAKKKKDGSLVYPPKYLFSTGFAGKHILEIGQFVTVDGVRHVRENQPEGVFTWFPDYGVRGDEKTYESKLGEQTDFYAFHQSCRMPISLKEVDKINDEWQTASNRYQLILSRLPPGEHKVKVDLVYRIVSGHGNMENFVKVFPPFSTPWSSPIASGEFTINTSSIPISLGNIFPKRKTSLSPAVAKQYEDLILDFLRKSKGWGSRHPQTEVPFAVAITGDWYPSGTGWFHCGNRLVEEITEYSIAFTALFYRSPETGWSHEEIRGMSRLSK